MAVVAANAGGVAANAGGASISGCRHALLAADMLY
jgi:hypothetical protein